MTKRVILIGHPVAHSLSGAMQQAAFDSLGIDATYELWDRSPMALAGAIEEIRGDDFLGANVTIPHKERVVPLVDRLTDEAHVTGAVNTITREGKRLIGHNTDVPGFKVALDRLVGKQKMPRQAVVLGAGGGARAVVYGLITRGVPADRGLQPPPPSRRGPGQAFRPERGAHGAPSDAVARLDHRVGAGQDPGPRQRDLDRAGQRREPDPGRDPPWRPAGARPHLRPDRPAAGRRVGGATVADGESMLLHQGAAAFTLWTGQAAPLDLMQRSSPRRGRRAAVGRGRAERPRPTMPPSRGTTGRPAKSCGRSAGDDAAADAACRRGRAAERGRADRRRTGDRRHRRLIVRHERRRARSMGAFRFLTAGESHGPALGATIEGVPAGLAHHGRRAGGRSRPSPEGLRPRRPPGDRAGPRRDPRRRPPRPDPRVADPPARRATATGRTGPR